MEESNGEDLDGRPTSCQGNIQGLGMRSCHPVHQVLSKSKTSSCIRSASLRHWGCERISPKKTCATFCLIPGTARANRKRRNGCINVGNFRSPVIDKLEHWINFRPIFENFSIICSGLFRKSRDPLIRSGPVILGKTTSGESSTKTIGFIIVNSCATSESFVVERVRQLGRMRDISRST